MQLHKCVHLPKEKSLDSIVRWQERVDEVELATQYTNSFNLYKIAPPLTVCELKKYQFFLDFLKH